MNREEIIRILDLALEQSRADACNGCEFSDTEEWEETRNVFLILHLDMLIMQM